MLKLRGGTTYLFWMKMAWDEEGVEGVQCDSGEVEDVSCRLLQCAVCAISCCSALHRITSDSEMDFIHKKKTFQDRANGERAQSWCQHMPVNFLHL